MSSRIVTPNAEVILFNFTYRLGSSLFEPNDPSENKAMQINKVMQLSQSIISIDTDKNKSNPAGSFRLILAPDYNWLSKIDFCLKAYKIFYS